MSQFTDRLSLETRALNIQGTLLIHVAVSGKGHDSGYSKVRDGLEALGFRVVSDKSAAAIRDDEEQAAKQASEAERLATSIDSVGEWLAMRIDRIIERLVELSGREHVPGFSGMQVTPDEVRLVLVEVLAS